MISITSLFAQAQLAEASYADLSGSISGSSITDPQQVKARLVAEGFGDAQASAFVSQWRVVDQYTAPFVAGVFGTGYSATLFQNIETGSFTFAVRGTNDLIADIMGADFGDIVVNGIAMDQLVDMYNYWQRLTTSDGVVYAAVKLETMVAETAQLNLLRVTGGAAYDAYLAFLKGSGAILDTSLGTTLVRRITRDNSGNLFAGTPLAFGAGKLTEAAPLDVVGHSLGGHLAAAFTRLFPQAAAEAITINGAGFPTGSTPGLGGNALSNIQNLFSELGGAPDFNPAVIANVHGTGPNVVTMNSQYGLVQQGSTQEVFSEHVPLSPAGTFGHGVAFATDSLAVYDLFARLDPTFNTTDPAVGVGRITDILAASSAQASSSLERSVDALVQLFGLEFSPLAGTQVDDREALYQRVIPLQTIITNLAANSTLVVDSLPGFSSATDLANIAQGSTAFGYRYALRELNPFAILGNNDLYAPHNQNGELDLYDPVNRTGTLTSQWITDRAEFLSWRNQQFAADGRIVLRRNGNENVLFENRNGVGRTDLSLTLVGDLATGGNGGATANPIRVLFGGDGPDALAGGILADRIYGGNGVDFLEGRAGNDYLEGGNGLDVYNFSAFSGVFGSGNDGNDVILDTDGRGVLRYTFKQVGVINDTIESAVIAEASRRLSGIQWQSADGRFNFTRGQEDLIVSANSPGGGSITLKNFHDGDFGIYLREARLDPQTSRSIQGDLEPQDVDPNASGVQLGYDALGNVLVTTNVAVDRADTLFDSADSDLIESGSGDDVITATHGGGDWLRAGAGRDAVTAGNGADLIEGGADGDVVIAGAGDDQLFSQEKDALNIAILAGENDPPRTDIGDLLAGGTGDDIMVGGATADLLLGGADQDLIVGGTSDDTIYGDVDIVAATLGWTITRTLIDSGFSRTYDVAFDNAATQDPQDSTQGQADSIYGGAGADWVFAGGGDDYLDGGSGDDALLGDGGSDSLIGGDGNDFIDGDSATAVAAGLAGNDFVDGGAGNDILLGEAGDDIAFGGAGDDVLSGGDGADVLIGGSGIDVLAGGAGKDTYIFNRGDGTEVIVDTPAVVDDPEASILVLGEGISRSDIKFRLGSLLLDLGDGDSLRFEDFNSDDPLSTPILDAIQFADGTSMSYQDALDQGFDLDGTDGNDVIEGTAVIDRIDARAGNDTVNGKAGNDSILGGVGDDILLAGSGNDILNGGEGSDNLGGEFGEDVLAGNEGVDELLGGDGNDVLEGGAGEDRLVAGTGDDILKGGTGSDALIGNDGSDVYLFSAGDGLDTVDEKGIVAINLGDTAGTDIIRFSDEINPMDVTLLRYGNGDLKIRYGAGDEVTINGQYGTLGNTIERIEFADGTVLGQAGLNAMPVAPVEGTAGNDILTGTTGDDTLLGFDGDDVLDGGSASDRAAMRQAGSDVLEGGPGADTYLLYFGMGADTFIDASPQEEASTLQLAAGLTLDGLRAEQRGNDLFVGIRGSQDGALIEGYYDPATPAQNWQVSGDGNTVPVEDLIAEPDPSGDAALAAKADYEQRLLSNWSALSQTPVLPTNALVSTSWSQTTVRFFTDPRLPPQVQVLAPLTDQFIEGFGVRQGNDFLPASDQQIIINPAILTRNSNSTFINAQGIVSEQTNQQIHYGVTLGSVARNVGGTSSTTGFPTSATTSNTIVSSINESWRNITLTQGAGSADAFTVIQRTEGRLIEEINGGSGGNIVQGVLSGNGDHVAIIDGGGNNDSIIAGPYDFANGGTDDDSITGGYIVYGGAGNDTLNGGVNLFGGAGNDLMAGVAGATWFVINPSDAGVDIIRDAGGIDPNQFENWYYQQTGIAVPDEHRDFGGMFVVDGDTRFNLNHVYHGSNQIDLLGVIDPFSGDSDGRAIAYASLADLRREFSQFGIPFVAEHIRYIDPLPAVPQLVANDYAALAPLYADGVIELDTVEFENGIDFSDLTIVRNAIGTTLDLIWGQGKSVSVQLAQAQDPIGTGVERFRFADGSEYGILYLLEHATQADSVIVGTELDDFLQGSEANDLMRGLEGNDFLTGSAGSDSLDGGHGFDFMAGGEGDDTYVYNPGDGIDFISDDVGSDVVRFDGGIMPDNVLVTRDPYGLLILEVNGPQDRIEIEDWFDSQFKIEQVEFAGGTVWDAAEIESRIATASATEFDDILTGSDVNDAIDGLAGDDIIYGQAGVDLLDGGPGGDHIEGGAGNDLVIGGPGDDFFNAIEGSDFLAGGAGNDRVFSSGPNNVIAFNAGDGQDTIYTANDLTLSLGGGIQPAALSLSQDAADLVLATGGEDSIRLVLPAWEGVQEWPRITLQMFGSVHTYDFNAVMDEFYQALAANSSLEKFALDGVLQAHQTAFSETEALGGALAYGYGSGGNLDGSGDAVIRQGLADPGFGATPQSIEIQNGNQAPALANPINDQAAQEDAPFRFAIPDGTFSDAGDTLAFAATLADGAGLPGWLSFEAAARRFDGTPANDEVGTLNVRVTATDTGGRSISDTFELTVMNVNDAPAPIDDHVSVIEDGLEAASGNVLSNDTDVDAGANLAVSNSDVYSGTYGELLLASDGSFSYTLDNAIAQPLRGGESVTDVFGYAATDGMATAPGSLVVTVVGANDAPVVANLVADQTAIAETAFSYAMTDDAFVDIDQGDVLNYGAALPAWLAFDPETRIFSGIPGTEDAGNHSIQITAADRFGAIAVDEFQLTVATPQGVFLTGTRQDDLLVGTAYDDTLLGGRGDDRLYGESGDDVLAGEEGDNLLEGGAGDDVYVHERNGGNNVIEETGGQDVLRFGDGIAANVVRLYRSHDDLLVDLAREDSSVTIRGWFALDAKRVERIEFANGTAWDAEYISSHLQRGSVPQPGHDDRNHEHDDDPDRDHDHDHGQHHGKSDPEVDHGRDDRRSGHEHDRIAELLEAYLAHHPRYDFEALSNDLDQGGSRRERTLGALEIAEHWRRVGRYGIGLSDERDDDARHGTGEWGEFDALSLLGGGGSGGAFGHTGSTGLGQGLGGLKTLEGLDEGFQRIRA